MLENSHCERRGSAFLSKVDAHDQRYDEFVVVVDLKRRNGSLVHAVPLKTEFGSYTLGIYPTQDKLGSYLPNEPMIYTNVRVCAFLSLHPLCFVVSSGWWNDGNISS